jgi:peptide/nickel transport system permease protein
MAAVRAPTSSPRGSAGAAMRSGLVGAGGLWRALGRLPLKAKVGLGILSFFLLITIIGPEFAPYDPNATTLQTSALAPTSQHLLGTTATGQDVLSQLLDGIRATVVLGLATGVIATVLAIAIGVTAGFVGGVTDEILGLLTNVFLVLPALPLLIIVLGYLPQSSGQVPTAIVLSALGWAWGARVIRAQTLTLRNRDYVLAARESGERSWRIIVCEILPNEVSLIAANFVGTVLYAILTSIALAFIGVTSYSSWSLGTMLYWAQGSEAIQIGAWWWYVPPGVCAALIGMSLVLINFGLDELGNPRLRDTRRRKIKGRAWRPSDPTPVIRGDVIS